MASDSERDISVGGIQIAPTSLFDRRRLRRARTPARPADPDRDGPLQRLPARLLVLRGRPHQGLLAGRPRRRRRPVRRVRRRRRCRGRWRTLRGRLDDLLADPGIADAEDAWLQVDAHRRASARCTRWTGCARGSRTRWCSASSPRAPPARAARSCPASTAAATTTSPSASSRTSAAARGHHRGASCCCSSPATPAARRTPTPTAGSGARTSG